ASRLRGGQVALAASATWHRIAQPVRGGRGQLIASGLVGAPARLPGMPDLFRINRLDETGAADTQRLPHTVRILLEGLLRNARGMHVRDADARAPAQRAGE